jgi:transcriptional regulator GlxA family with amidase domain
VIERRVERGKQMLRHTDLSIIEIGLATGFADQSHFTKTFRRSSSDTARIPDRRLMQIFGRIDKFPTRFD